MKKWTVKNPDEKTAEKLAAESDISLLCAKILVSRGITDISSAAKFIDASEPETPFALKDMQEAADAINEEIENGGHICIYGDYDCDGIISTVMLYSYLECIGADVGFYIPERDEGYGMNEEAIRKIADDGTRLIITVDNGISAIAEAELIRELGMKLVVTDHHQPGDELPAAEAVVDPHRKDSTSAFRNLCGAGVVLKLIAAMEDGNYDIVLEQFGDLAAIATIADVVELSGENRFIVKKGFEVLANTERPGLAVLMSKSGVNPQKLSASAVAFGIAPRINAAGRFASPKIAVELLLCENEDDAESIADKINELNAQRKKSESGIIDAIREQVNANHSILNKRVLVFSGDNWHHGIIGIVAARLEEMFGKPCFVITNEEGGVSRGSARSFGDFSVFKCLEACSDKLLKFGGHTGAGGFSLNTADVEAFDNMIQEYAREHYENMPVYSVSADKVIMPNEVDIESIRSLSMLEPFGEGNPEPLFIISGADVVSVIPLSNGVHTKLILKYGGIQMEALIFRESPQDTGIKSGEKWNFMVSMGINEFRGKNSVSTVVKDRRKCGINQEKYIQSNLIYEKFIRGEDGDYSELCPTRQELTQVYKYLGNYSSDIESLYYRLGNSGIEFGKLRICIDIFAETGLVDYSPFSGEINRIPVDSKVNLEDSSILRRLNG